MLNLTLSHPKTSSIRTLNNNKNHTLLKATISDNKFNTEINTKLLHNRRNLISIITTTSILMTALSAEARDVRAAIKAKEERKKALKEAALKMRETKVGEAVFKNSDYAVPESKSTDMIGNI